MIIFDTTDTVMHSQFPRRWQRQSPLASRQFRLHLLEIEAEASGISTINYADIQHSCAGMDDGNIEIESSCNDALWRNISPTRDMYGRNCNDKIIRAWTGRCECI